MTTRRFMALRKATAASEAGVSPSPAQRAELARLAEVRVTDGPFTESKELIAGYVIVKADSLEDAGRMAARYIDVVEADEVDVRELEDGERMRNA